MERILCKLEKSYYGSSLARIAVEVGEEEDIRLLVQSGSVDWNETVEDEDPAILWALKNEKFRIVEILMSVNEINIRDMNSNTLSSMIHYIYTGELAEGWQDLDFQDVKRAADMYNLPGWIVELTHMAILWGLQNITL